MAISIAQQRRNAINAQLQAAGLTVPPPSQMRISVANRRILYIAYIHAINQIQRLQPKRTVASIAACIANEVYRKHIAM